MTSRHRCDTVFPEYSAHHRRPEIQWAHCLPGAMPTRPLRSVCRHLQTCVFQAYVLNLREARLAKNMPAGLVPSTVPACTYCAAMQCGVVCVDPSRLVTITDVMSCHHRQMESCRDLPYQVPAYCSQLLRLITAVQLFRYTAHSKDDRSRHTSRPLRLVPDRTCSSSYLPVPAVEFQETNMLHFTF